MIKLMEGYETTVPRRIIVDNTHVYAVFRDGTIRRVLKNEKLARPLTLYNAGFRHTVQLGRGTTVNAGDLVALCYLPNPEGFTTVAFRDGNSGNVKVCNLYWSSCSNVSYLGKFKHTVFQVTERDQCVGTYKGAKEALASIGYYTPSYEQIQQVVNGFTIGSISTVRFSSSSEMLLVRDSQVYKNCAVCNMIKPIQNYSVNNVGRVRPACKSCQSIATMTRRKLNEYSS